MGRVGTVHLEPLAGAAIGRQQCGLVKQRWDIKQFDVGAAAITAPTATGSDSIAEPVDGGVEHVEVTLEGLLSVVAVRGARGGCGPELHQFHAELPYRSG